MTRLRYISSITLTWSIYISAKTNLEYTIRKSEFTEMLRNSSIFDRRDWKILSYFEFESWREDFCRENVVSKFIESYKKHTRATTFVCVALINAFLFAFFRSVLTLYWSHTAHFLRIAQLVLHLVHCNCIR